MTPVLVAQASTRHLSYSAFGLSSLRPLVVTFAAVVTN
jgi:hypothetical protein